MLVSAVVFTLYLERGTLTRTPGHACQRNKRPLRLFPQMQKVLWFCKGSSQPFRLSLRTCRNTEAQTKLQTKCLCRELLFHV